MRQRRVEGGEHTVEEGRIERPLLSVDGKEIEILDDGAEVVLVRPEGERERLIVEFEGAVFFRAQALQNGEINAIGLPSQFGTEFGRTLFSVVVDEDRHIFIVTAPLLAGRCASCGRTPSCRARPTASCGGASSPCAADCLPCRGAGCLRCRGAGCLPCCAAASDRVGCLRCSVVVVVAVKLFHSEKCFCRHRISQFIGQRVFPCSSSGHFIKNNGLF